MTNESRVLLLHIVAEKIMKAIFVISLLALLLSACSRGVVDVPAAQPPVPVANTGGGNAEAPNGGDAEVVRDAEAGFQTGQLSYTLATTPRGIEGQIDAVFANNTGGQAFIVNCNGTISLTLEKQVDDKWVRAWAPIVPYCLSEPIVIEPDQEYQTTVYVFGSPPGTNVYPKFEVDEIPGVYRIVWRNVLSSYDHNTPPHGETLPVEQRTSNHFRLDVE